MDDGWTPEPEPTTAPRPTTSPGGGAPATIFSARALLRLGMDIWHEGPRPGQAGEGYSEDVMELFGQALANLEHRVSKRLKLKLGGRLRFRLTARRPEGLDESYYLFNGSYHRNDLSAELLDSYLALNFSWLDLQAGVVTEVWGAATLTGPNDVLAAQDLRDGPFLDAETSRLPAPLVKAEVYLGGFTIAASWLPVFMPHRVDSFGSDFALFGPASPEALQAFGTLAETMVDDSVAAEVQGVLQHSRLPRPLEDSSPALRVGRGLGGWDVALMYAWLHERQPAVRIHRSLLLPMTPLFVKGVAGLTEAQQQQLIASLLGDPCPLESVHRRYHHVGASLAGSLWKLALSLDVAYQSRQAFVLGGAIPIGDEQEGGWLPTFVDSQVLAYTAGATYTHGEEWLVTLEWWHRLLLDELSAEERAELTLSEGPQLGGLALLVRHHLRSPVDLTFQVLVHSDLLNPSVIISPQVSYRPSDHLAVFLGANVFEGIEQSLAGRLDQNDQLFLGVEGFL
jgi:hypothetical protein